MVEDRPLLHGITHSPAAPGIGGQGREVLAVQANASLGGPQMAGKNVHQRAFADPVASQHAKTLAFPDFGRQPPDDHHGAVAAGDPLEREAGRGGHFAIPV